MWIKLARTRKKTGYRNKNFTNFTFHWKHSFYNMFLKHSELQPDLFIGDFSS